MSAQNSGYSYKFTISGEELNGTSGISVGNRIIPNILNPPRVSPIGSPSFKMDCGSEVPLLFQKIVEPRFDGIGMKTGIPVNKPDFISESHFLGIMHATDKIHSPKFVAMIKASADTTGAKK